ncbi:MAG: peptidase C56 [Sulfurimonas sp. RIFOXYD12_FULL_33_39]|nr:MAG: peptidase C56 [Sulfurimonas sp. RIFCSPLOWO2_12_FULL_34_6]OHE09616.1 MAG: peptidase C56 [Sulfurimonas sp. RIFOXYD12_FULL_33_39]OHE13877.1 MAG: peptidase C56 [Sulfurimonas sp. RIFOXYD2_FULL_34_21]
MNMQNKLNLNQLLFNYHKNTVLIPTFVVAVILFSAYFFVNTYVYTLIKNSSMKEAKTHGQEILLAESKYIGNVLGEVSRLSNILQKEHEYFFSNPNLIYFPNAKPQFEVAPNGVYYKTTKNGSSLYYSSDTKITHKEMQKALRSEVMDVSFKSIVDSNKNIVAAYFNSWDNMNRLYPYIDEVYNQYGSTLKMSDYNFYYLADEKHDTKREPVWTDAYLDPAGNGWMISCVVPIYNKDFLEGVTGIDIPLKSLISNLLERKLPWSSSLFMLDKEGAILAMPQKIEKILNMSELTTHTYIQNIKTTIKKPLEYNLIKNENSPFGNKFVEHYKNKTDFFELSINSQEYILMQTIIEETGWRLMLMIEKNNIFYSIYKLKSYGNLVGYSAIVFAIVFYLGFVLYTLKRSRLFALEITNPIEELSKQTTFVGSDKINLPLKESNIEEIDQLNFNFSQMVAELKLGKINLIQTERIKKEYKQKANEYHEKSLIDPLSGLYNRLKCEEVINKEIEAALLYEKPLSLIMLDIDNFKNINDTLGHLVGDEVIKEFSKIIKNNSRKSDVVIRNGGDEFVIICTNTELKSAKIFAQNLKELIQKGDYPQDYKVTSSIGVTSYKDGDKEEDIIDRVDRALYIAKEKGRNRVESL